MALFPYIIKMLPLELSQFHRWPVASSHQLNDFSNTQFPLNSSWNMMYLYSLPRCTTRVFSVDWTAGLISHPFTLHPFFERKKNLIIWALSLQWPDHFSICYCFPAMSLQDVAKYEDVVYRAPVSCHMWIVLYKSCGSSDMCFEVFGVSLKALGPVSFVWLDDEFYTGRICCLWKIDFCVEELPTYFLRLTSKYNKCCQGSLVLKRMDLCISVCGNLCMYSGLFSYLIIINYQTYVSVTQHSLSAPSTAITLGSFISS